MLQKYISKIHYTPLHIAEHVYAWSEIVFLLYDFFTHQLTANPIQALEQRTGLHALTLLILSLACTPLNTLLGWRELLKRRRALGLYGFMYAAIHISIFLGLDFGFMWGLILQSILEKPYIVYGLSTFLLLIPLAVTSFDIWKVRLGKNWKRLHQIVYFIVPLGVLHYALSVKGDIFHLEGDIARPLIYSLAIIVLLLLRISFIRRFFASIRTRIRFTFSPPIAPSKNRV